MEKENTVHSQRNHLYVPSQERDNASLNSDAATESLPLDNAYFNPTTSFVIKTQGIRRVALPMPSNELETEIYHADGVTPAYTSTRAKLWSHDAVLSSSQSGEIMKTTYHFGPGRETVIEHISQPDPVKVGGHVSSNSQTFTTSDGKKFEWRYCREETGQKSPILYYDAPGNEKGKDGGGVKIAKLVRDGTTRTRGSTKHSAGNGGLLMIDSAPKLISEPLVIATCLIMLKTEMDRRRTVQALIGSGY